MPRYHRLGDLPAKHHIQFRKPDGGLYEEELFSTFGFSGPMSTMYHIYKPTEVKSWEDRGPAKVAFLEEEPLRHRHLLTPQLPTCGDMISGRVALLGNSDVVWYQVHAAENMDVFFKNAEADEILFIHDGSGRLRTNFGTVEFRREDYLVVPRGVIWRIEFDSLPVRAIVIESKGPVTIPRRYRNEYGQLLEHAPYKERDFRPPTELETFDERRDYGVLIKARDRYTLYTYPYHPFDIVGWDGYVYPYAFNIRDFQPIVGQIHMPPPIHQTFDGHNFVICSFCPRMLDFHPQAIVIPYNHSNVDSDEVLYYCNDKFGSRKGIQEGSITLHPLGIPHGPQPGAVEASLGATRTEELAVMLDTFHPLKLTADALRLEDEDYWKSWLKSG
ncbi:MAG: homogentisate 1,2-dioxygenase [Fimbriimonadaceae bacterium]|uniref:Homogentisate 1,2-dioxygenase n=1 Tax=Candidatus Nitrosymbiomonas proteolyticus TaxID=2608984 RepID=A0A809S364_9BACT|nr:homogentisate 1,2-dioxygenase [Fimbriimonadaceae bacterium]NUM38272.1 homogentisate 1,2-dioxygenase [Armatimonadota bacterium]BBO23017.1 homogentisate 1,2-dioxygenase [Candidatus Nitrosymbiomonas proteolyticus]